MKYVLFRMGQWPSGASEDVPLQLGVLIAIDPYGQLGEHISVCVTKVQLIK
jgi:hypothetical protein